MNNIPSIVNNLSVLNTKINGCNTKIATLENQFLYFKSSIEQKMPSKHEFDLEFQKMHSRMTSLEDSIVNITSVVKECMVSIDFLNNSIKDMQASILAQEKSKISHNDIMQTNVETKHITNIKSPIEKVLSYPQEEVLSYPQEEVLSYPEDDDILLTMKHESNIQQPTTKKGGRKKKA